DRVRARLRLADADVVRARADLGDERGEPDSIEPDDRDTLARLDAELVDAPLRVRDLLGPLGRGVAELEADRLARVLEHEDAPLGADALELLVGELEAKVTAEDELVRFEERLAARRLAARVRGALGFVAHGLLARDRFGPGVLAELLRERAEEAVQRRRVAEDEAREET